MVTVIYTTIVFWNFIDRWLWPFLYCRSCCDTRRIPCMAFLSVFLRCMYMYICCKQSVDLLFLHKRAFSIGFLFRWISNWGILKFSLLCVFSFYTFADVVFVSCFCYMFWVWCCFWLRFRLGLWLVC